MNKIWPILIILVFSTGSVSFAKTVKTYYPDGTIKSVAHYGSNNQLNGPYKYFWPDGQLKEQGRYKNGELIGPIKKYSPDGGLLGQ